MKHPLPVLVPALAVFALLSGCGAKPDGPLDAQIDAIVQKAHARGRFTGNVLVTRNETTVYEKSLGLADVAGNVPHTGDTRFLAFSVLKPMTAVLVFQQIDSGRLKLTDTLESLFPTLAGKPAGRVTLRALLTHTSGLPEVISEHLDRRITPRDLETAAVKPGGAFEYSNTGYVTLGLVLEAATGCTYGQLLQERILQPAGMNDSGLARTGRETPNLARGYHLQDG